MANVLANNAVTKLLGAITESELTLSVTGGTGALFPITTSGDTFKISVVDSSNNIEIMNVTSRTGDIMTVQRAQEGTTARAYSVGDRIALTLTAASFNQKLDADVASATYATINTEQTLLNKTLTAPTITDAAVENITMSGQVTAPTQTTADNSDKVATTAFVKGITGTLGTMSSQNANAVAITGGSVTDITDLTVADGGTGVSTLPANALIVGNGTSAVTAIAPSTSGNVLTSNGTTWASSPLGVIGVSQTWQSVSRALGTTYTNDTGKPIEISVRITLSASGGTTLTVGGVAISTFANQFGDRPMSVTQSAIIPNGVTYSISATGSIALWAELR